MTRVCDCGCAEFSRRPLDRFDLSPMLHAPFEVWVHGAIEERVCVACGASTRILPPLKPLVPLVAILRAADNRKLSGREIRFLRKSINKSQKSLARDADYTAETLCRFEGEDPLTPPSIRFDRFLRASVCLTYHDLTHRLALINQLNVHPERLMSMEIKPVRDASEVVSIDIRYPLEEILPGDGFGNHDDHSPVQLLKKV